MAMTQLASHATQTHHAASYFHTDDASIRTAFVVVPTAVAVPPIGATLERTAPVTEAGGIRIWPAVPKSQKEWDTAFDTASKDDLTRILLLGRQQNPTKVRDALKAYLEPRLRHMHLLQRHLEAFRHDDAYVTFTDTYATARALNISRTNSVAIALFSHATALGFTGSWTITDDSINAMRHPAVDSGAFDARDTPDQEEQALTAKIDKIMSYAQPGQPLTRDDIARYVNDTADARGAGWFKRLFFKAANKAEFGALLDVCGGTITREQLHDFYKGTLLFYMQQSGTLAGKLLEIRQMATGVALPANTDDGR